jgi:hypothetical protein
MMTMLTMVLVAGMTIAYFERSMLFKRVGGSLRDANLAQTLAEAGMGRITGQFASVDVLLADINGSGIPDRDEGWQDLTTSPTTLPLGYSFYAKAGNPTSIIRRVAIGEGAGTIATTLNSQRVDVAIQSMRVNDLFISGQTHPLLFTETAAGGLAKSAKTWDQETSSQKVAVWLELEVNPSNAAFVDIYCATASQYGKAKSYLRQFVGTYQ